MSNEGFVKTLDPDGVIEYHPRWIENEHADRLMHTLVDDIDWQTRTIRMFGRHMVQPRLIAFMGDRGIEYQYSGTRLTATGWHPELARLRERLEDQTGTRFNSLLLNLYRDGRDSMGWHSDDEPELGSNPVIASVSLGAARRFVLRARSEPGRRVEILPGHGSLIVMRGDLQHHWQHQVPRTRRRVGPRVNLTFRRIDRAPNRHLRPGHPPRRSRTP